MADPLLVADASDLKEIKAFCMYAWKNKSRWFYNCTEEEGNVTIVDYFRKPNNLLVIVDIFLDDAL